MKIHELGPAVGSKTKVKRIGRGTGSGTGKTAGKGHKGQKARTGGKIRRGFEGGQTPIMRRIPKRGFHNVFSIDYATVNVSELEKFEDGTVITMKLLKKERIVRKELDGLKILGNGELTKKLTVEAKKFSDIAKQKIEKVGGKIEVK